MIKDLIGITILTWLIELGAKLAVNAVKATSNALGAIIKLITKQLTPPITEKGIVTKAIDGDSLIVKTPSGEKEVRIKGIDAPEYGQEGFKDAKRKVQSLTLGQEVTLSDLETDKYGRTASKVELDANGQCIAEELASSGVAYPDPRGSTKPIKKLSKEAKKKSLGVWKKHQTPPWEFRELM